MRSRHQLERRNNLQDVKQYFKLQLSSPNVIKSGINTPTLTIIRHTSHAIKDHRNAWLFQLTQRTFYCRSELQK